MPLYLFMYKENAVNMVGHDTKPYDFYLRVITRNAKPFIPHPFTQRRQYHMWLGRAILDVGSTSQCTQQRPAPLDGYCNKIDAALCVVVYLRATFHGGFLTLCPLLVAIVIISHIACKDKQKRRNSCIIKIKMLPLHG